MKHARRIAAVIALSALASVASATPVMGTSGPPSGYPGSTGLTFLGAFGAGTYQFTATGIVDIAGDGKFRLDPDGKPPTGMPVTESGYNYFNPNGADNDMSTFGPAGAGVNLGSLIGTFTTTPSGSASYFAIGSSRTITLAGAQTIYGLINDTFYGNNTGSFDVTITQVVPNNAVSEPSQGALVLVSLGALGVVSRKRLRAG